jgi:predicted RNase H-like HicB family nuclease
MSLKTDAPLTHRNRAGTSARGDRPRLMPAPPQSAASADDLREQVAELREAAFRLVDDLRSHDGPLNPRAEDVMQSIANKLGDVQAWVK